MSNNNGSKSSNKRKGATLGLVFCFTAAIALVGTYTVKHYQSQVEKELALAKEEAEEKMKEMEEPSQTTNNLIMKNAEDSLNDSKAKEQTDPSDSALSPSDETTETAGETAQVNFSAEDQIFWPVSGDVLMNYSMDQTIYFATLDQYKYNPALIISGAVNDQVIAAAAGIVKSIDMTAETGTSVTVDLGNGYEAVYGQLKEVPVKVGDHVESKATIGYLSEPTKYYSVEGSNLYFEMRKDGQTINPMDFLE